MISHKEESSGFSDAATLRTSPRQSEQDSLMKASSSVENYAGEKISYPDDEGESMPTERNPKRTGLCCRNVSEKWRITITGAIWGFLTSVERAIILPTMWLYLTNYWSKDVAKAYYGATLAAFGLAILVCTPIFGWIVHKGISMKIVLIAANQLEILGNLIYLVAPTPWLLILGRLICGIGASIEPPLYADLIAATKPEERTLCIIIFLVTRQVGLMFGPACTLLLHNLSFKIGEVSVTVYNSPGLLMACFWILHTVLVICIYSPGVNPKLLSSASGRSDSTQVLTDVTVQEDKRSSLEAPEMKAGSRSERRCHKWHKATEFYGRFTSVTIYLIIFASYFSVMGLESVLSPFADTHFGWTEVEVSYVYLSASFLILLVCFFLQLLSKRFEDRQLIFAGLLLLTFTYAWQTLVTTMMGWMSKPVGIAMVLTGVALHVIAIPFPLALSESLYTKLLPVQESHAAQSILRTVINVAYLVGPAVGGALYFLPNIVFLMMLVLVAVPTCMMQQRFLDFKPDVQEVASTSIEPLETQ
ncbi:unnamed protein product [Dibothriocephalus latus]|uniref:Major facilitator superfamily (MFS) profile domain-containing protein n=1 Tax=Dibothriocephalus latus TaxID=60516 RepID=A0A3P6VFB3_DIBLA|nr:unnamed protein product [Dibothriocephalus latus]